MDWEKIFITMGWLIAIYLGVRFAPAANNIINQIGNGATGTIGALQGF